MLQADAMEASDTVQDMGLQRLLKVFLGFSVDISKDSLTIEPCAVLTTIPF